MEMKKIAKIASVIAVTLIASLVIIIGCTEPVNVMQVCTKKESGNACATGFFIAGDSLVTAGHMMDESKNGELHLIERGINTKTKNLKYLEGKDIALAVFSDEVSEHLCPICDTVEAGANVALLGVLDGENILEEFSKIEFIENDIIFMDIQLPHGFSGGPVVDLDKNCVVGVIAASSEDLYLGAEVFLKSDTSSLKLED